MAEERERQFKYRWTRTWDDTPEHYTAWDGERSIGIVHRLNSISAGGWYWACNAHLEWLGSDAGTTETKAEACREVEAAYDALVARIAAAKARGWKPGRPV